MPIRGENVGTAYVRILADGSGLSDQVRDDLQKGEADFARAGDDDAAAFGDAYAKRLKKDRPTLQKDIEKTFTLEGERIKRLTDEMGSNFYRNMEKSILRRTSKGRVGEKILGQIRKDFLKGGGYDAFGKGFEDLFARLPGLEEAALREMAREEQRATKESINLQKEREREFQASVDRAVAAYERIGRGEKKSGEKIRVSIRRTIAHIKELHRELEDMPSLGGDDRDSIRKTFDDMETGLVRVSPRLRRFNGTLGRTVPVIGRAFGKESRNDFIHFFGSSIQGISSLIFKIPKLAEGVLGVVGTFKELRQTTGIFKSLTGAFSGAGKAGSGLFSSLAAGAVAIPIVVAVIGTMVSAVSLLLGTITALASTISFALVGALGVLAGAMAPVAAGIAVLVAGIASMSDAQKKALKEAIKPFTDEMRALGQIASKELFRDAPAMASRLGKVFTGLRPLVKGIAISIREVADGWIAALEGPGFKRFKDEMGKFLPDAVKSLGQTFGNVIGGIGGLFVGLIPATERFLGWLNRITEKFADWANSASGQNQIKSFMDDALESAKSLGHFIGELGGLLGDLLFNAEGKKTGDSLFDSMADAIKRFRDYIADGKLEQWFKDSKKFAEDLGDALVAIGKVLDALDSPGFRSFASFMIDGFTRLASVVESVIEPIANFAKGLKQVFEGDFSGAFDTLINNLKSLPGNILNVMTLGFGEELLNIGKNIIQGLWDGIVSILESFISFVGSIPQRLIDAFIHPLGIASPSTVFAQFGRDIIQGLLNGLIELLTLPITVITDLASRLGSAFTAVIGPAFDYAKGKAKAFAGFLSDNLSNAMQFARDKASSVGSFFSGGFSGAMSAARSGASRLAGMFTGTLASAFKGARSAAGGVRDAFGWVGDKIDWLIGKVKSLINWLGNIKIPSLDPGGGVPFVPGIKTGGLVDAFGLHKVKKMAHGGLANFAQKYQIGEAGREAIVPLNRPLGQVDPAVRLLSAFAQGKLGEITNNNGRTLDASGWVIQTDTADPAAVAQETLDALVAKFS